MTLAEFLLARISEDEEAARLCGSGLWATVDYNSQPADDHGSRWKPARALAECEAKKRIVAIHHHPGNYCPQCVTIDDGEVVFHIGGCPTLRLLALPFADHPDYDESWRPA